MYCSKCGTNVTDGAAFCSACGQPTAGPPTIAPTAARPTPGLPPTYAQPVLTHILPSPYAGFWLRVVAHLIDDLLLGIGIGILVLIGVAMVGVDSIRSMAESMKGDDFQMPGAMISAIIFVSVASIVMVWLYNAAMESSKHQGTLGKNGAGVDRYGPARAPNWFRSRHRKIFRKNYHRTDSLWHRLRHGGIHGKEASAARHDRGLPRIATNLARRT